MAFDAVKSVTPTNEVERAKRWEKRGDELFQVQQMHCQFWQRQCEIFYPERADFTSQNPDAAERYENIFTGIPQLMRRDMANNLGAMLRPRGEDWMKAVARPARLMKSEEIRQWCEDATDTQRNIIYAPSANFARAMSESDNDYVAIGNSVVALTDNDRRTGLLFTCLHPRDCAWAENAEGVVDELHRKLSLTVSQAAKMFGRDKLPKEWQDRLEGTPHSKVTVRQCVAPIDTYDYAPGEKRPLPKFRYHSIWIACGAKEPFLSEGYFASFPFLVRRWMTVSGEAYGRSPCAGVALADSRTLNVSEAATLKAIEWQVDPPKIVVDEAVIGDIKLVAGEVTYVNPWDSKNGKPIENVEAGESRIGMEFAAQRAQFLGLAFFQNVLKLPDRELTAYEARERLKLLVREAAPIIEPMEAENARLMDATFERIMGHDGFEEPPEELQGAEVVFEFETPLTSARKELKAANVVAKAQQIGIMAELWPDVVDIVDSDEMGTEAFADVPAKWLRKKEEVAQIRADRAEAAAAKTQAAVGLEAGKTLLNAKPENLDRAEEAFAQ